jgi:hypothetical protein
LPSGVAWIPLLLKSPLASAAGPLSRSVRCAPRRPARLIGTKKSLAFSESVNQAPVLVIATSLIIDGEPVNR